MPTDEYVTRALVKTGVDTLQRICELCDRGITVRIQYVGQDQLHTLVESLAHRFDALEWHLESLHKEFTMAKDAMLAALKEINDATNNIAADIEALKGKIGTGMSDADVAEVQGVLDTTAKNLRAIADSTPDAPTA